MHIVVVETSIWKIMLKFYYIVYPREIKLIVNSEILVSRRNYHYSKERPFIDFFVAS